MARLIKISPDEKLAFLCKVFFTALSPVELLVLKGIIGEGASINLSGNASKTLRTALNLNENTFNVSLSRLAKKGVIRKNKGLVVISPIFADVDNVNEFLIRFEAVTG